MADIVEQEIKDILENKSNKYKKSDIKFAICMATFKRKNDKSKMYLQRSINSILNQTASNWTLILVGDKYEDDKEFNEIVSLVPVDKIIFKNLDIALERDNIKNINDLWKVGGCNAYNNAHFLAIEHNFDYILHFDDDDVFNLQKIELLNCILNYYPDTSLIFHYSRYISHSILPREKVTKIFKNNLIPQPTNVIHSSYCIKTEAIKGFKFKSYEPDKKEYLEGDIQFLKYLHSYLNEDKSRYCIFLPIMLCMHDIEGEVRL
jgi:glycosyltransferase involved in cell wall biosynthesis